MDEFRLIKEAQKGNIAAFNQLVLDYQQMAYNVAYRVMGEKHAAEDMTQEAFILAYKSLNQFQPGPDSHFKSWLLRIVTNSCYDGLRYQKRRPYSSIEGMSEEREGYEFIQNPEEGPEEYQQRAELAQAIERCLQNLPDDQRITAVLCDMEGYDYNSIAQILKISLGTVKSRISRARIKLRDCLQGIGELLPSDYRLSSKETPI